MYIYTPTKIFCPPPPGKELNPPMYLPMEEF